MATTFQKNASLQRDKVELIGHVNVQSCLLIFLYQPINLQYSLLIVVQPIRIRLSVVYASWGISNTVEDNSDINIPY